MHRDLQSVVKIMKTISASNIREYEQAVESLGEYNKTIEMGFQIVMRNKPKAISAVKPVEKKKRLGAVIFGSDQGLCGSFNEQIAGYADREDERDREPGKNRRGRWESVLFSVSKKLDSRQRRIFLSMETISALPRLCWMCWSK